MATWREKISYTMECRGETLNDIQHITLTNEELDVEFDDSWGGEEGKPFTAWTENYVYFPASYDGSEWVASVPRNPCNKATEYIGGG